MRLSTLFTSTAFVLAGISNAIPVNRENMLAARYADAGFLADVKARAYDEELGLYTRGCVLSTFCGGGDTGSLLRSASSESSSSSSSGTSISNSPFSSFTRLLASTEPNNSGGTLSNPPRSSVSRTGYGHSGTTPTSHFPSRRRRSLYEPSESVTIMTSSGRAIGNGIMSPPAP